MLLQIKTLLFIEALLAGGVFLFVMFLRPADRRVIRPVDIAIILGIPLVGVFGYSKTVFYVFMFLVPLLAAGSGRRLACIYLLALPLYPALREGYLVGSLYLMQLSAVAAFNLGGLVALLLTRDRQRVPFTLDLAVWLLFLLSLVIAARDESVTVTLRSVADVFLSVMPPYFIISRSIRTRAAASDAMLFFILGAMLNAVVALFETRGHWPLFEIMYRSLNVAELGTNASLLIRGGFMRAQGALFNHVALALLMGLAIAAWLVVGKRFSQAGRWIVLGLLVLGLLASQSRGGWLAAAIGLGFYFLHRGNFGAIMSAGLTAALAAALLFVVPADSRLGESLGRSGHGEETSEYRSQLLRRGLEEIRTHPLRGQSNAQLQVSMDDLRQGEHIIDFVNTPLWVALSLGLVGLMLWTGVWVFPMAIAWRRRGRRAWAESQPWLALPFACLAMSFACLIFTSPTDRILPWTAVSIGLLAATSAMQRASGRERAAPMAWKKPMRVAVSRASPDSAPMDLDLAR